MSPSVSGGAAPVGGLGDEVKFVAVWCQKRWTEPPFVFTEMLLCPATFKNVLGAFIVDDL